MFNQPDSAIDLRSCKSETFLRCRQHGADVSEFDTILWRAAEFVYARLNDTDGLSNCVVIGIVALSEPEQDVGINKVAHQLWP